MARILTGAPVWFAAVPASEQVATTAAAVDAAASAAAATSASQQAATTAAADATASAAAAEDEYVPTPETTFAIARERWNRLSHIGSGVSSPETTERIERFIADHPRIYRESLRDCSPDVFSRAEPYFEEDGRLRVSGIREMDLLRTDKDRPVFHIDLLLAYELSTHRVQSSRMFSEGIPDEMQGALRDVPRLRNLLIELQKFFPDVAEAFRSACAHEEPGQAIRSLALTARGQSAILASFLLSSEDQWLPTRFLLQRLQSGKRLNGRLPVGPPLSGFNYDYADLRPVAWVRAGGHIFYLSRIYQIFFGAGDARLWAAGYVQTVDAAGRHVVEHRLFYKSGSDGTWRVADALRDQIGKGPHYTAAKLARPIAELLWRMEQSVVAPVIDMQQLPPAFGGARLNHHDRRAKAYFTPGSLSRLIPVVRPPELASLEQFSLVQKNSTDLSKLEQDPRSFFALEDLAYPEGFIPDFHQEPVEIFHDRSLYLGDYEVRVYSGGSVGGREILWEMAETLDGIVWIHALRYADDEISATGTTSTFLVADALSLKPLDYHSFIPDELQKMIAHAIERENLRSGKRRRTFFAAFEEQRDKWQYVDITPLIALLRPVREYAQARGITLTTIRKI